MTNQFQPKLFLTLLLLPVLDLITLKFTMMPPNSLTMQHHLKKILKAPIHFIVLWL